MSNVKNYFIVTSAVFFMLVSGVNGNNSQERRPAPAQDLTISEMGPRRRIVEFIKDHKRLDSAVECEDWPLQAWLDEKNEMIVLNDQERRRLIAILKEYKERPHTRSAPNPSLEEMSDPEKTEAHMQRRKKFLEKARIFTDSRIDPILARLGDPETIDMLVNQLTDRNYRSPVSFPSLVFRDSKQPAVIPALTSLLFIEEGLSPSVHRGRSYSPRSLDAAFIIMHILGDSDQFPEEVGEWARSLRPPEFSRSELRELVRAWWKVNEEAMLAGKYMKTRPLTEDEHKQINKDD